MEHRQATPKFGRLQNAPGKIDLSQIAEEGLERAPKEQKGFGKGRMAHEMQE